MRTRDHLWGRCRCFEKFAARKLLGGGNFDGDDDFANRTLELEIVTKLNANGKLFVATKKRAVIIASAKDANGAWVIGVGCRVVASEHFHIVPPSCNVTDASAKIYRRFDYRSGRSVVEQVLQEEIVCEESLRRLETFPENSVDLFFTSPPYADARAYSKIHPDKYVEWFLPFAKVMLAATKETGSFVLNINNRVAKGGRFGGQRHAYIYELVIALQELGWRWIETYIWEKPNAIPGKFGPRTKDSFEYVYHFAKGSKPYFDLDAIRVPYKTTNAEIERRKVKGGERNNTDAGFGRDRAKTYGHGGADPGNVVRVPQTYNQHYGVKHPAAMPENLAEFFIKAFSPEGGIVIDPFAGSGTTLVVGKRLNRRVGGIELRQEFVDVAKRRLAEEN